MPVTERKSRGVEGTHESSDRRRMTRTNREVSMEDTHKSRSAHPGRWLKDTKVRSRLCGV